MRAAFVLLSSLLAGCAGLVHPLPSQPRALMTLPQSAMPLCLVWCTITLTIEDAEGANVEGTTAPVTLTEGAQSATTTTQQSLTPIGVEHSE
jgi:hypothetical protein